MWHQTYGGKENDEAFSLVETGDGGYAVAGYTASYGAGSWDFWLVKTNASGSMQWNQTYGGTDDDYGSSVVATSDGGYAIAGHTHSYGAGGADVWLVKTDASGSMQWNQTYGGTSWDYGQSVVATGDGGYAIAGHTHSYGAGSYDAWLVKTDAAGTLQWNQTYGGTEFEYGSCVVATSDGGYAIAGHTYSFGAGDNDFWLVKTDAAGTLQWNQTYGGTDDDRAISVVETIDGGYAIAGYTKSFGAGLSDAWLVKTDANGNMQWNQTYGGTSSDQGHSVVETGDGGYAIAGYTWSFAAGLSDFWLVKTDASGSMQWNQTYGGTSSDFGNFVVETADGGYAVVGTTTSYGAGEVDFWLVKTDESGVVPEASWVVLPLILIATSSIFIISKKKLLHTRSKNTGA